MIAALHRLLPASAPIVRDLHTLTADNVLKSLDEQKVHFDLIRLSSNDWEVDSSELTDDEIYRMLHMEKAGHEGDLRICTEACTRYGRQPFRCDARDLQQFVHEYDSEMFFDGDVIILSECSCTLTVYHHAGGYAHVSL